MRSYGACILAALLYSGLMPPPAGAAELVSVHSPSRHFLVTGDDVGQTINIARWADEVSTKIERALKTKIDFKHLEFRIHLSSSSAPSSGCTGSSEKSSGRKYLQTLLIKNPDKVDWEDVLELHCRLLLDGLVVASGDVGAGGRRQPVEDVPAWLPVGLSHCIDPALKSRDRRVVLNWQKIEAVPPLSELLKWRTLPSGRSREKAACTMMVAWLLSFPDAVNWFEQVRARLVSGDSISSEWLATVIPGCHTVADVELMWTERLAGERFVLSGPGLLSQDTLSLIKDQLVIRTGEYGIPAGTNLPQVIELKSLVAMKDDASVQAFCKAKALGLLMTALSGSEEVRAVAAAYSSFFGQVGVGGQDGKLLSLLAKAEDMLKRLETTTRAREEYMDKMEETYTANAAAPDGGKNASRDCLERSKLQRYIDGAEERFEARQEDGTALPGAGGSATP